MVVEMLVEMMVARQQMQRSLGCLSNEPGIVLEAHT
jgi:hypothetical protein